MRKKFHWFKKSLNFMDYFFASNPLQLISLEIFKNDKKCFAWAKL